MRVKTHGCGRLLVQQSHNFLRSRLHQRLIPARLHVQAHYRLGIRAAQVEAPVAKRHADAVRVVNLFRVRAEMRTYPLNGLCRRFQLAVDLPAGRPRRHAVPHQFAQRFALQAKQFGHQ
ncbi:Uncharacterised protein [Cedecea neteri]|uniref:Uncharacterized protein n=1 Tax=Cedecea neteri TaxID=158822 RepID=A0A2X3J5S6_9ENTR|nr:Uncharacterised protein [Cedecea neteri]